MVRAATPTLLPLPSPQGGGSRAAPFSLPLVGLWSDPEGQIDPVDRFEREKASAEAGVAPKGSGGGALA